MDNSLMRNEHRGQMWRGQDGKCHFCNEPMEKWPYPNLDPLNSKTKQPRPRQAVMAHINSRFTDERGADPAKVLAHYECQHKRSRHEVLVTHRQRHLIKSYLGLFKIGG